MEQIDKLILDTVGNKAAIYLTSKCKKEVLSHYLLLYWLTNNIKHQFSGKVPGFDESSLTISRNHNGKYDGHIMINDIDLDFVNSSILDISATIAICLDLDNHNLEYIQPELRKLINSLILGHKRQFSDNMYTVKFSKLETKNKCSICRNRLFKQNKFVGCWCFANEGTESCDKGDFVMVRFDRSIWERDEVTAILQMLKK